MVMIFGFCKKLTSGLEGVRREGKATMALSFSSSSSSSSGCFFPFASLPHCRNGESASLRSSVSDLRIIASSSSSSSSPSPSSSGRRPLLLLLLGLPSSLLLGTFDLRAEQEMASPPQSQFSEILNSGGVKVLDIKQGVGSAPRLGDKVVIHYYARLAAKQGWRFDSTYDHKDQNGAPEPFVFTVGSDNVIAGLDNAVRTMREGGIRRAIIPPSQGYLNTSQEPIPPNFFDRQRLFTTIFNPTRLANGEGSTLGTLVFDIELLRIRPS